jgi:hypothetical protein
MIRVCSRLAAWVIAVTARCIIATLIGHANRCTSCHDANSG